MCGSKGPLEHGLEQNRYHGHGLESRDIKEVEPVKFDEWLNVLKHFLLGMYRINVCSF